MDADLVELAQHGGDYLLVGGWRSIDGLPRLPADRDLRHALGGTMSSLGLRMARKWMTRKSSTHLYSQSDATRWESWARRVRRSEQYQRATQTDTELLELISVLVSDEPNLSASRALRIVRDRGIACEQKRFGALFRSVGGAR
jgi:hypothetical protein